MISDVKEMLAFVMASEFSLVYAVLTLCMAEVFNIKSVSFASEHF